MIILAMRIIKVCVILEILVLCNKKLYLSNNLRNNKYASLLLAIYLKI